MMVMMVTCYDGGGDDAGDYGDFGGHDGDS